MDVSQLTGLLISFGGFEVDPCAGELHRNGSRIRLQQQPFQILLALLAQPGEVVTREQLRRVAWPQGTFVDFDHALNTAIKKIRCALEDDACVPRFIETVPKRGYRFIAEVETREHKTGRRSRLSGLSPGDVMLPVTGLLPPTRVVLLIALLSLVTAAAGYNYFEHRSRSQAVTAVPRRLMLVVLPFENLSSSSSEQYFCDGVSEELTTQLSRLDSARLGVAARTTAMQYRHAAKSVADIGRDLKVDYVLEGSVRHDSGQVRVTAQLVRVSDQSHLWAADFDRAGGETLALQSDLALAITRDVAAQLLPALSSASR